MAKGDVHVAPSEKGWRVEIVGTNRARSPDNTNPLSSDE